MLCFAKTKAPRILLSQRVVFFLTIDCEIHGHRFMGYLGSLFNVPCMFVSQSDNLALDQGTLCHWKVK